MDNKEWMSSEAFLKEDPFGYIGPEAYETFGIDPREIPAGTYPAHKHPAQLLSRFGGNAYGLGFLEACDRLGSRDYELLQSAALEEPEQISISYRELNRIFRNLGLLKRFSSHGKPYYLIPIHLESTTLSHVKSKADEISKIIRFHRRKYLKESHKIGILTHEDDLLISELAMRFKEHEFVIVESFEKLGKINETLDLFILPHDPYETVLLETSIPPSEGTVSRKRLRCYLLYLLGKIHHHLKPDGEIFIITDSLPVKMEQALKVNFKTALEEKNFLLFSHIFKTQERYEKKGGPYFIQHTDFQRYLSVPYVEKEVMDHLLGSRRLDEMTFEDIHLLPYLDFPLKEGPSYNQRVVWARVLSPYFDKIFLKPLMPDPIKKSWEKRFATRGPTPDYMLIYIGQKRKASLTLTELKSDVMESGLSGCPLALLADYRDSFDYLLETLSVLKRIKDGTYTGLPELFIERLRESLEGKRGSSALTQDLIGLLGKRKRLERIKSYLNPDLIEGIKTPILSHLETLNLFGFTYGELKEIFLIIVGHTAMGRILSGKMNEKGLKPLSDLARTLKPQDALDLLRHCRLMSVVEAAAIKQQAFTREELAELLSLYESLVRVVTNREMDWDRILYERQNSVGGIRNQIIRKILKMMNDFPFLGNWPELRRKGDMEKEAMADYDEKKLARIDNVLKLVETVEHFEDTYLKADPLELSIFYRKFLNTEFYGTMRLFERLDSHLIFILLWITVNVVRGNTINFNDILADVDLSEMDRQIGKIREEGKAIHDKYLAPEILHQLSAQLYETFSSFILGTGFQLRTNRETGALDIAYIDVDRMITTLEILLNRLQGIRISEIPIHDLTEMEHLFSHLESFYQSHLRLMSSKTLMDLKFPERQRGWFRRSEKLRELIKSRFTQGIFKPEEIFTDLNLLYRHVPSLLRFVLPEFMALGDRPFMEKGTVPSPLIEQVLASAKKIQALVKGEKEDFQDIPLLHKKAQREFGPMTIGIIGLNDSQLETLENLAQQLSINKTLFDALIRSFVFRHVGLIPALRKKYRKEVHPADYAQAGALFLEKEDISRRYQTDDLTQYYLVRLVRNHDLLYRMIKGEFSFFAIEEVISLQDRDLFEAFFLGSFIMFFSMGEDLIMEDLATKLFQFRTLCHRILDGETTSEAHLKRIYIHKGHAFRALENYLQNGIPQGFTHTGYLESYEWKDALIEEYLKAGKLIYAMERIFRLKGMRYVEFPDLANFILKVPLKYIYKKRRYYGVGYATFEKEIFEAHRIYNGLHLLPEEIRHFILERLITDEMRIFGLETVTAYMNYENLLKLLFIALLGAEKLKQGQKPISLIFTSMAGKIEKRYEAMNETLNAISTTELWRNNSLMDRFFRAKTGLVLKKDNSHQILSVDFIDKIHLNISRRIRTMEKIADLEMLKDYFHKSLTALRRLPFYGDDHEEELERAYHIHLKRIADHILDEAKAHMERVTDFKEIHSLLSDLISRSHEIGFTEEQKNKLNDIYELRKDAMKREKLGIIHRFIEKTDDVLELKDYWKNLKEYLKDNRPFLGTELETIIAKRFDEAMINLMAAGLPGKE